MNVHIGVAGNQLEAKSPFELRASLSKDVPESVVKGLSRQARWDFCIRSRPGRPLMGQVCALSPGRLGVIGVASTVTTPTRGT